MAVVLQGQAPRGVLALIAECNKLQADLAALKAAFDGHVHGGVTVGAANTAAAAASPALTSAPMQMPTSQDG